MSKYRANAGRQTVSNPRSAGEPGTVRLVGIDVDGTLVGKGGAIHPRVWESVRRAQAAGVRLALCSGRPAFGLALDYARRLQPDGWHIFQNGASIVDVGSGRSQSTPIPQESVKRAIEHARVTGDLLELYSDTDFVAESESAWAYDHAVLLGVPYQPGKFESLQGPAVRAQWLLTPEKAEHELAKDHPGLELALSTSPLMPDTRFLGMTRAGVSKGSAMRTVAAAYGFDLRDVMYVGDADNDLPALRIVGHPIAMANASRAVLETAERRVASVDDGGLADALEVAISATFSRA